MWFYVALGGLFTLYAMDLLMLVIISAIARAKEIRDLLRVKRKEKKEAKRQAEAQENVKPATFAFGNAESIVQTKPVSHLAPKPLDSPPPVKTRAADTKHSRTHSTSPPSPLSTPVAPPCPEPQERPLVGPPV